MCVFYVFVSGLFISICVSYFRFLCRIIFVFLCVFLVEPTDSTRVLVSFPVSKGSRDSLCLWHDICDVYKTP